MAEVKETVAAGLAAYYEYVAAHLHKWVDLLSNDQFWLKPYPYGNSAGHLVLHLTGNLSYYIGARVAGRCYVRDRDREFTEKQPRTRTTRCAPLTERSPWLRRRFENRMRTIGKRNTPRTASLWPRIVLRFLCVVPGMRIIM